MKHCSNCKQDKELSDFHCAGTPNANAVNVCKKCKTDLYEANKGTGMCFYHKGQPSLPGTLKCGKCIESVKRRKVKLIEKGKCPNHPNEDAIAHGQQRCHLCVKRYFERQYSMTLADYDSMFQEQEGRCKGCLREFSHVLSTARKYDKLLVDHCHDTGEVRWLLCVECNSLLGKIEIKPDVILRLAKLLSERSGS